MKTTVLKSFSFTALLFSIFSLSVAAQISQSNNQTVTPEVQKAQEAVNKILDDSGKYFREGLQAFKENRRVEFKITRQTKDVVQTDGKPSATEPTKEEFKP